MLERGLLPARLPDVPGVQLAARYVPAEHHGVGGDWYDAFTVPSGRLWFVVGDVAGHGLGAAVVMGRVKSAFRSYALQVDEPERVLELTDRKVRHFEMGTMVTMLCATAMPPYDVLEVSSAGHLPPIVALPRQRAQVVKLDTGRPLGLAPASPRTRTTLDVPDGALVIFYTDGLIERRDRGLRLGLTQLCEATSASHPETACQSVMHHVVGNAEVADDIALLAFRRRV
jgi:serine phosphatase RsbU (regulator of sigma subunit)